MHMNYTAGRTTHLAARMEQTAGSILMTAETLRLAEGYVQVKSLEPGDGGHRGGLRVRTGLHV